MTIVDIQKFISSYTENAAFTSFSVHKDLLIQDAKREKKAKRKYNELIRKKVEKKYGVYIWENEESKEIIYIGMAGKVKQNGMIGDQTIDKRLTATRQQILLNEKKTDVLTGDYLLNKMNDLRFTVTNFYIIYLDPSKYPPTYIESVLLFKFLSKKKQLPILNNSF